MALLRVFWFATIATAPLILSAVVLSLGQGNAQGHPELSGEWVLNRDLSTNPTEDGGGRRGRAPNGNPEGRRGSGGGTPGGVDGGMRGGLSRQ